jgi:hypothetical protein
VEDVSAGIAIHPFPGIRNATSLPVMVESEMQQKRRSGEGFPCNDTIAAPFIFKQELTLPRGASFINSQAFATALAQSLTLIMHAKITHALRGDRDQSANLECGRWARECNPSCPTPFKNPAA